MQGIIEETIPNVRLTRSANGSSGTATFYFESPRVLDNDNTEDITGMYFLSFCPPTKRLQANLHRLVRYRHHSTRPRCRREHRLENSLVL